MWLRIVLVVLVVAELTGCSPSEPTRSSAARPAQVPERLPPEVTGDPASALPKQKSPVRGR